MGSKISLLAAFVILLLFMASLAFGQMVASSIGLVNGVATVNIPAFTNTSSYACTAKAAHPTTVTNISNSVIAINGTGNDTVIYSCEGD